MRRLSPRCRRAMWIAAFATACRSRHHAEPSPVDAALALRDVPGDVARLHDVNVPDASSDVIRVAEGSQPRWRYLARGPRPRGIERWRMDLAGRDASGEPATDGQTVYVAARHPGDEVPDDGEVYALDLRDGSLRWHVPVGGLHGEPVDCSRDTVLLDTVPHCTRRTDNGACAETSPGGIVGLDAATGHERFHTAFGSDALHARWTAAVMESTAWLHDGPTALHAITLPDGDAGLRWNAEGTIVNVDAWEGELVATVRGRRGTRVQRRASEHGGAAWSRAIPYPTACPPVRVGPLVILAAFSGETLAGAVRALTWADGVDLWTSGEAPHTVATCGTAEGAMYYQAEDGEVVSRGVANGRRQSHWPLPGTPTTDLTVLIDGVFYLSLQGRLVGVDLIDGHTAVSVPTDATRAAGMVLWGGHGVVATQDPGVVIGFE